MREIKTDMKVRCIDDHFVDDESKPFQASKMSLPEKGNVYSVREVIDTPVGMGLRLEEVKNRKIYFENLRRYEEPILSVNRFEVLYQG